MRHFRPTLAFSALLALAGAGRAAQGFPDVPLPPPIEPPTAEMFAPAAAPLPRGRSLYLERVRAEAERNGLPFAVADAVATVESAYNPNAVGGVGEIGLMQVRPTTAAMLGYRGPAAGLFDPDVNVRYGVLYLAQAWRLTDGDLCETLMKYRAGHGETRMSALSVQYCVRARLHLASIGSPLANAPVPPAVAMAAARPLPKPAIAGARTGPAAGAQARMAARRTRWAAQDARIQAIESRISSATLSIMR